MSSDVREQIRVLVGEYDQELQVLGDITVDEVVTRVAGDVPPHWAPNVEPVTGRGPRRMPRRSWVLAGAASVLLVVGLVVATQRPVTAPIDGALANGDVAVGQIEPMEPAQTSTPQQPPPESLPAPVILGDEFGAALVEPLEHHGFEVDDQGVASSGLARPSFYDWPANLTAILDATPGGTPIVATFGGNDTQLLVRDDATIVAPVGDPLWASEYRTRVDAVMDQITSAGHPLVWVGVPTTPDRFGPLIGEVRSITIAAAAANDQVTYIDTWDILEAKRNGNIGSVALQSPGGYHLSAAGGRLVAAEVASVLEDM